MIKNIELESGLTINDAKLVINDIAIRKGFIHASYGIHVDITKPPVEVRYIKVKYKNGDVEKEILDAIM